MARRQGVRWLPGPDWVMQVKILKYLGNAIKREELKQYSVAQNAGVGDRADRSLYCGESLP